MSTWKTGVHQEEIETMTTMLKRVLAVAGLLALSVPAVQAGQDAGPILFETRQLDLIEKGHAVTYRFVKKGSDERLVGKDYADDLSLGVTKVDGQGSRDVVFQVFTGASARDPQNWPELTINPLFIWYLDRTVSTFNALAGGSQQYLKHKIREALGEAKAEAVKVTYDGKEVDGFALKIVPFESDPNASKMQGFHKTAMTIVVSNQVPGYFVDLKTNFVSTQAAGPELEERVKVVGLGEAK